VQEVIKNRSYFHNFYKYMFINQLNINPISKDEIQLTNIYNGQIPESGYGVKNNLT